MKKHGLDFVDAIEVFEGDIVTMDDDRFDYGEQRFVTLGVYNNIVVVIAHTEKMMVFESFHSRRQPKMSGKNISKKSLTNRDSICTLSDEDIDLSEIPEIPSEMFDKAGVRYSQSQSEQVQLSITVDEDVAKWLEDMDKITNPK